MGGEEREKRQGRRSSSCWLLVLRRHRRPPASSRTGGRRYPGTGAGARAEELLHLWSRSEAAARSSGRVNEQRLERLGEDLRIGWSLRVDLEAGSRLGARGKQGKMAAVVWAGGIPMWVRWSGDGDEWRMGQLPKF